MKKYESCQNVDWNSGASYRVYCNSLCRVSSSFGSSVEGLRVEFEDGDKDGS